MEPVPGEPGDAELVKRLQAGDLDALGVLFDRYYAQIFRTAVAITHDEDAAEDIVQDCFLRLHRYANRIDTDLTLPPWLYRVTVNLAYTWLSRHHKRRVSLESVIDYLMSPARSTPDYAFEIAGLQTEVHAAIAELRFNQRVVVVLHYLNGLSVDDIASILDCPVGTVKSRLYYARENLRHQLVRTMGEPQLAHGHTR
jgi:RNA polymerase sigma-70 factor (ECF subfamily)